MGKPKKNRGKKKPGRKRTSSAVAPQLRLAAITDMIREEVYAKRERDGVSNLLFMVIHGLPPNTTTMVNFIAEPHWDAATVDDIFYEAFESYKTWGNGEEQEKGDLVENAVVSFTKRVKTFLEHDERFAETVIIGAYPGGATVMGYLIPKGKTPDQMRKLAFSVLNLRYPGVNEAAQLA